MKDRQKREKKDGPGGREKREKKDSSGVRQKREKKNSSGEQEMIRLNKYISNSGVCSRRDADNLISGGEIKVNGQTLTDLGTKISPDARVEYKGNLLNPEKKVYILLNKPAGYVSTVDDPHADKLVTELIKDACSERVYPVGRLDRDTTGLLLFTNDGELTKKLTHPSQRKKKVYHVHLNRPLTRNDMIKLTEGINIEEETVAADAVAYPDNEDKTQVGIELHSGQNRVVRRMFEQLGYKVKKLDRVYFAGLTKKNLPRGKWRHLSFKEVNILRR
ncbi:MAG: pseudouridine synthase [Bacteroidales bacterium]|nr:pseudouridine synthase [Bacteroidales bacterium]